MQSPVVSGFFSVFKPDPILTVSTWADENRYLPSIAAAEPGRWRTSRTPYLKDIMDDLSPSSPVENVTFMKGAQIGGSECGNNWVGYVIDKTPGPMLLVQPTVDIAKRFSQQRIAPLINESPCLRDKVADARSRDSSNTQMMKEFPGGVLLLAGANSAAPLRSMPIRFLFMDEVDAYPHDIEGEGDPVELATARTRTFSRRKILKVSTPTIKGASRIEKEYLETDQRRYFVPCPHCGHMDFLRWERLVVPKSPAGKPLTDKAHMVCFDCGGVIEEHHKTDMLSAGEWRPTCPEKAHKKRRGYHLSSLYSPVGWFSWSEAAAMWFESQGNPTKLQAFVNTVLGETWEVNGESVDDHALMERAEPYTKELLPAGVLVLTAGVDVQPDRLEVEVVGTGIGEETWSIDYHVIRGDPNGPLVWQMLDLYLMTEYQHPCGIRLRPARTFTDSGGSNTIAVYDYVRPREHMGIYAIKGIPGDATPAVGTPTKNNIGKIPLVPLGVNTLKDTVFGRLRIQHPGAGYCHFPQRYDASYYKGLTAEEVRIRYNKGFAVREWHKRSASARNEPLDVRVYATAAFISLGVNLEQLAEVMSGTAIPPAERSVRAEFST